MTTSTIERYQPLARCASLIQGELLDVAEATRAELERAMLELAKEERKRARALNPELPAAVVSPVRFNLFKLYVETLEDALRLLLPLTGGTRWLFTSAAIDEPWVAFFYNRADCRGYKSLLVNLAYLLKTRTVYGLHEPTTLRSLPDGRLVGQYGAVQVEVYKSQREPERVISLVNDAGRWVFQNFGRPYSFEKPEKYERKKKTDRFTPQDLIDFLAGFGLRPYQDDWYRVGKDQPVYLMERIDYDDEVRRKVTTPIELQRIRAMYAGLEE